MAFWPEVPDLAATLRKDLSEVTEEAEEALRKAKATVLGALGGQLLEAGELTETIATGGDWILRLSQRPVVAVTSIDIDGTAVNLDDVEVLDARAGTIERLTRGFGHRDSRATVTYSYGYTTLPEDLRNVVLASAVREFENPTSRAGPDDRMGGGQWRLFPGELSRTELKVIERYTGSPSGRLVPVRRDRLMG